jgi:gliding motility-associated-like protein
MFFRTKIRSICNLIILLLTFAGTEGFSQGEANNWFIVGNAAMTFNFGAPQNIPCPNALGVYGTAVASDTAGNLLFYTNGEKVYTKTHQLMQNGDGLLGKSFYQPVIAFRKPGSDRYYYIFTIGNFSFPPNDGLRYSLVDMEANGGEGKVISKNLTLTGGIDAMDVLTATLHKNNRDIWVITRKQQPDKYIYAAYLVTPSGISDPVNTNNLKVQNSMEFTIGGIRVSPNGKKFFDWQMNDPFLGDFDNSTGLLSKICIPTVTGTNSFIPIGGEFSNDSKYFYICGTLVNTAYVVYQYDANATDSLAFVNSEIRVGSAHQTPGSPQGQFLWMQAAPDGKIYGIRQGLNTLFTINYPDNAGTSCDFQINGFTLAGNAGHSLPQFVTSYLQHIYYSGNCAGTPISFTASFQPVPDSIIWNFGDGSTSPQLNPTHTYTDGGNYTVTASVVYPGGRLGEAHRDVFISDLPHPDLGNDITICKGTSVQLSPGSFASYLWGNSTIDSTLNVADTGLYFVKVTNEFGCINSDTVSVSWYQQPTIDETNLNLAPTTCGGTSGAITGLQINGQPPYTYQWAASGTPLSDALNIFHLGAGLYELSVTDGNGCSGTLASYVISDAGKILIDTASGTPAYCDNSDGTLTITAISGLGSMLNYFIKTYNDTLSQWSDGKFTGLNRGTYYVWVSDSGNCVSALLTPVIIEAIGAPAFASVSVTPEYCGKHDGTLTIAMVPGFVPQLNYFVVTGIDTLSQWGNPVFKALAGGSYHVWVSDSGGCVSVYPLSVFIDKLTKPVIVSVTSTPENSTASDGTITVVASCNAITYSLDGGIPLNNGCFTGLAAGTYLVKVSNAAGCDTSFMVTVNSITGIRLTAIAGDGSTCLGNVTVMPLLANGFMHVSSFNLQLKYNNALVTCQNYLNVNPALADSLHVDLFPSTGELKLRWNGLKPVNLQDRSTLAELSFSSLNSGQDSLKWDIAPGICTFKDSLGNSINRELIQGQVRVYSVPEAEVPKPLPACEGGDVLLMANYTAGTGNGTISYHWTGPGGFTSNNSVFIITNVSQVSTGQYMVSLSDSNHCRSDYYADVSVIPPPVSGFASDTIYFDEHIQLEAEQGYDKYRWNTGDSTYSVLVSAEGWYKVTIKSVEGCTSSDSVMMLSAFTPLTMPNAFKPDGKSVNAKFRPVTNPEKISSISMYIFDRWGKQVYYTNDVKQGWDGKIEGSPAQIGGYVYVLKYGNSAGAVREIRGMVTLVR